MSEEVIRSSHVSAGYTISAFKMGGLGLITDEIPLPVAFPNDKDCDDVHRAFALFRNYVTHEDSLINERLQRLLVIQGFLFAAEATLLPKFAKCAPDKAQFWVLALFAVLVPTIGGVAAHFVHPALMAARDAITHLGVVWKKDWKKRADAYQLPELLGGGAKDSDKNGHKHILHIVYCFMAVWLVVLASTGVFIVQSVVDAYKLSGVPLRVHDVLIWVRWPKSEVLVLMLGLGVFRIWRIYRSLPRADTSEPKQAA